MGDRTGLEERQKHDEEVAAQNQARQVRQQSQVTQSDETVDDEGSSKSDKPKGKAKSGTTKKSE